MQKYAPQFAVAVAQNSLKWGLLNLLFNAREKKDAQWKTCCPVYNAFFWSNLNSYCWLYKKEMNWKSNHSSSTPSHWQCALFSLAEQITPQFSTVQKTKVKTPTFEIKCTLVKLYYENSTTQPHHSWEFRMTTPSVRRIRSLFYALSLETSCCWTGHSPGKATTQTCNESCTKLSHPFKTKLKAGTIALKSILTNTSTW